jgi:predicted phosphodiesterase/DNA-directed RNA polymerase subunit RPC12/RpoP
MKLLVTGDWHYRANPPRARLDDFQATLDAKIKEVLDIADREAVDGVIVPGDITDSPNLAYSTLTRLENLLEHNIYAVPGNHDEFAGSQDSLPRTAYGHLTGTQWITDLAVKPTVVDGMAVTGAGFSTETDNGVSDYLAKFCPNAPKDAVRIHVAHGMLLERAPGFEMKHTLLEDVAKHPDCPDVLCVGHEHLGFGVKRLPRKAGGEIVFINPGALVRLSAHPGEMERTVQVCLLEAYSGTAPKCVKCNAPLVAHMTSKQEGDTRLSVCPKCGYENWVDIDSWGPPELWGLGSPVIETTLIPLASARPAHEVLSREHLELQAAHDKQMDDFMSHLKLTDESRFLDIQAILEGIVKAKGLPEDVRQEGLARIAVAREAKARRGQVA